MNVLVMEEEVHVPITVRIHLALTPAPVMLDTDCQVTDIPALVSPVALL